MAITRIVEKFQSRPRSGGNVDLIYFVYGSDDDAEIHDAILDEAGTPAGAPLTHDGKQRRDNDVSLEQLGNGLWMATVPYGNREWGFETGANSYTFDTSGGTVHITHSKKLISKWPPATAPDIGTADGGAPIGATGESVEGLDIPESSFIWEETYVKSAGDVTQAYKDTLALYTPSVNTATYKGCAAGEVLFLGSRGSYLPSNEYAITFRFARSRNATGIKVGTIIDIVKAGWHYMDVIYEPDGVGAGANALRVMQPRYVYIHQVFDERDLANLLAS